MNKSTLLTILQGDLVPSLGVTEPGAVALCAAAASDNNQIEVQRIRLVVSPNIYKNCMAVGIPGSPVKGIGAAAALGALGGDASRGLEALSSVRNAHVEQAKALLDGNRVEIEISDNGEMLYIEAICSGAKGEGRCVLQGHHANIVRIEKNGRVSFEKPAVTGKAAYDTAELAHASIGEILAAIESCDEKDLGFLRAAADMNMNAARWGLANKPGMGAGAAMKAMLDKGLIADSMTSDIQMYTAAASDVRVSGSKISVMTCAGSGNHGITAIVPLVQAAERLGSPELSLLRALALSVALTIYVKHYSGTLSGMCGCGVASATGVTAGLCYLRAGSLLQIEGSIKNMAGGITGMICDGAKEGCSLKLSTAVGAALQAAELALAGIVIPGDNGIEAASCEQTLRNMGEVSARGMAPTDRVILDIMQHRKL